MHEISFPGASLVMRPLNKITTTSLPDLSPQWQFYKAVNLSSSALSDHLQEPLEENLT